MFSWNKYPLLRILIPFVAGIVIAFYTRFIFPVWILLLITSLCLLLVFLLHKFRQYSNRWVGGVFIFLSIFSFSLSYTQFFINAGKPSFAEIKNEKQLFTATVIETPAIKTKSIKLVVRMEEYKQNKMFQNERIKAIIYVARDERSEKIIYGDKLLFCSYLNEPSEPKNPKEFDYKRYLFIKNIYIQSYADANSWQKISEKNGNPVMFFANSLRNKFLKIFQDCNMDVQEYGVIAAILLGYNGELDPDLIRSYSSTGASHILSVSGLHVGIIYMIIAFFLRFLNKTKKQQIFRSLILLVTIWLYACITGLSPSVMRAATMFSFVAGAGMLNRKTNSYNSLMASLLFLLCVNPLLLFEVGFQFSYLAVFGIVWVQKPLNLLYKPRTKAGSYVWDIISVSLTAQLLTAPLAICYFHQFPNYFLLTNIIVITLTPIVIGFGIAVLVFSFWGVVYQYLSLALMYLIKSMNWTITTIESLPYSVTGNIDISLFQVVIIYLLILILASAFLYKNKLFLFQGLACAIIVMGMDIHKQIQVNQQKEIVFYSLKSGYAIDCIDGRNSTLVCDSNTAIDRQTYDYSIKNNHIYHRIKETENIVEQHFIKFHNKTILIIDQPIYAMNIDQKQKVNYILLNNNINVPIDVLQKMFDFDMIFTDGSYSYYRLENIRKTCAEKMIPYHNLKNQGAVIIM
jgi:competence protein ComEC